MSQSDDPRRWRSFDWNRFVIENQWLLYAIAFRHLGDWDEAWSVVCDVYLKVELLIADNRWENICEQGQGNVLSYIKAMVRNRAIDVRRRRQNEEPLPAEEPAAIEDQKNVDANEFWDWLRSKVKDDEWRLIEGKFFFDLEYPELAEMLGTSIDTAQKRWERLLKKLRRILGGM